MADIMTIRPPKELKNILHNKAERMGITVNALVLQILWNYFDKGSMKEEK